MQGIVLCRSGHRVHILERSPTPPESRGAGISCRENAKEFFDSWDISKSPYYVESPKICFLNLEGGVKRTWNIPMQTTSWKLLYYRLRANFDGLRSEHCPEQLENPQMVGNAIYEFGQTVTNVQYKNGQVTVEYESTNGERKTSQPDLVIAADGSRSRIRRILQPELMSKYAGYVAWRGVVPEKELSEESRKLFGEHTSLLPMSQGHILL